MRRAGACSHGDALTCSNKTYFSVQHIGLQNDGKNIFYYQLQMHANKVTAYRHNIIFVNMFDSESILTETEID